MHSASSIRLHFALLQFGTMGSHKQRRSAPVRRRKGRSYQIAVTLTQENTDYEHIIGGHMSNELAKGSSISLHEMGISPIH